MSNFFIFLIGIFLIYCFVVGVVSVFSSFGKFIKCRIVKKCKYFKSCPFYKKKCPLKFNKKPDEEKENT